MMRLLTGSSHQVARRDCRSKKNQCSIDYGLKKKEKLLGNPTEIKGLINLAWSCGGMTRHNPEAEIEVILLLGPRVRTCDIVPYLKDPLLGVLRIEELAYREGGLDGDNPKKNPAASSNTLIGTYKVPIASRDPKLFALESKIIY